MRHVHRDENKVAHVLVCLALQDDMNRVWLYDPLDCIHEILLAEFSAIATFPEKEKGDVT
jgi:hypothetical protein